MPAIPLELARVLQTVRRPGDFFATGRIEIFAPKIEVEGVGAISLPLLEAQAGQLIAIAEQAPYGRGEETLVDTAVRRTWQIAAERIRLGGRHWDANLAEIVARAAAGLGDNRGSRRICTSCWFTIRAASSSGIATRKKRRGCSPPWSSSCLRSTVVENC